MRDTWLWRRTVDRFFCAIFKQHAKSGLPCTFCWEGKDRG